MINPYIPCACRIIPTTNIETINIHNFCAAFSFVFFITISIIIGCIISKTMQARGMKTNKAIIIALSGLLSFALFARYGMTVTSLQGLFLFFVLLFASCSDLTTHTVDDSLWLMVLALSFMSISNIGISSMLLGAICVFIPQIAMALLPPHKTLGGADIKLSTALAFLLGGWRGIGSYLIGLVIAVIVMSIYNKYRNHYSKKPFALVPFLSIGAMLMFLI